MVSASDKSFQRSQTTELAKRLGEPRRWIQIVTGARQVGKTMLVQQVMEGMDLPVRFASADEPTLRDRDWLVSQ